MDKNGQPAWWDNGLITDKVEPPGFFQVGKEKECAGFKSLLLGGTGHPEKPEGGGKPSYDPKPNDEAGYSRNDDRKFQILRFW